ncbi:MAG: 2-C-methyl-D-erythritol 2,4-cyclodiphosphate synthase [Desulfobacterales bacterium]|nr:MAG: 2-C-methyl-D-erythritol 2,4-cyclodiphosphate synthase [Desulfobacterales bacterium]
MIRIGLGTDVHAFAENRDLVIGGVKIDYPRGLLGHSDADVLIHALCDAILGAAGLGDIGEHFPDTDPAWKNVDSRMLLEKCSDLIAANGYGIVNIDCIIYAQEPRISPHKDSIKKNLAHILNLGLSQINVKATTTEELGFLGRKQGIAAQCVVLIQEVSIGREP